MVRDRARKLAVRTAAGDAGGYARTARLSGGRQFSTAQVNADLIAAFTAAGWPVEAEGHPDEAGMWSSYPGPAWVLVSRRGVPAHRDPDFNPDDPEHADQGVAPTVTFNAPALVGSGEVFLSQETPGDQPPERIVEHLARELAAARARAVAAAADDAECVLCGDGYPRAHLLHTTVAEELAVCPACVFDGDLLPGAFPQQLAYEFDRLCFEDLAIPAGWAGVAALLACAAGPDLADRLERAWARAWDVPLGHWADPNSLWIWLPPTQRPAALCALGPGASLLAIIQAVEAAHPDLREAFRRTAAEDLEQDEDEPGAEPRDYLVEQMWPAVIALVVAFGTESVERFARRPPVVDLSDCLEEGTLSGHFTQLGSVLDPMRDPGVMVTLEVGVQVVAQALGFSTQWHAEEP